MSDKEKLRRLQAAARALASVRDAGGPAELDEAIRLIYVVAKQVAP